LAAGGSITTLTANLSASTSSTTVAVADAAVIARTSPPSNSGYLIEIDGEQMLVTAVDLVLATFTVVRNVNHISISAHTSGAGLFLETDQRGFSRPASHPDIGAFQTQGSAGPPPARPEATSAGEPFNVTIAAEW